MASVSPAAVLNEMLRHWCGEMNPADARFCGGCGIDLVSTPTCTDCGGTSIPGARFCNTCGMRMEARPAAEADPGSDGRLAALESQVAAMREEMEGLLVLKAQLDGAMQRMRQRGGPAAAGARAPLGSKPPASKATPAKGEDAAADAAAALPASVDGEVPAAAEGEASPAEDERPSRIAVIHLEDRPDLQDAIQGAVASFRVASYFPESALADGIPEGRPLLVVNLLASASEPLAVISDNRLMPKEQRAFIYATDGARGFVLGMTEIFAAPFEPARCAARILEVIPNSPRVLMVSEAVLGTPELRAHLVRQNCTTSIAFDERQALSLLPSVRPALVLIDLNLPRGEGLRLAGRIRADEHYRSTRLGFMWQQKIDPTAFRQFATRAALDFHFHEDELRRQLLQEFNPGGAGYLAGR